MARKDKGKQRDIQTHTEGRREKWKEGERWHE